MRFKLTAGLAVAVVAAWTFAGPVVSGGAWTLEEESGGSSAVGSGEGEHLPGGVGVAPGATEPAPTDKQAEEEFWADPPWQQAREKAEREAVEREAAQRAGAEREAAQHAAAEREAAQQREAAEAAAVRCVVPSLQGESLVAARKSLRASHCTLGKVTRAHGHRGALVVRGQSPTHGRTLASGAAVEVRLGLAKRRRS
jgi:ribosomal protein L35AE/L33A